MKSINTRRSIRRYADKEVTDELLNRLLSEATRTQTMGNMQLYSIVVTRSAEVKAQLSPAHFNQPMVKEAPVVLTVCADFNRATKWCRQRGATPGYNNLLSFMNAATDALLFTQTFCNIAEEEGLGLCFLGTTIYMPQTIIDVLHLPRLVIPVATITLGWPAEEPALSDRLPLSAVVHSEVYHDYSAAAIDQAYSAKEALAENRDFVKENNVPSLAHVYTDIRYTQKDNEAMSEGLLQVLRSQGFID